MNHTPCSRRQFFRQSATLAGTALLAPTIPSAPDAQTRRTAADLVPLGNTGLRISRLGIGTGTNSGNVQRSLGHDGFNRLVRHAYDRGVTYLDTADSYKTHDWIRQAIQGLPREKFVIVTKVGGNPQTPLETLDRFRKELDTDYLDVVLVHCTVTKNWSDERQRIMDGLREAQEKKILRARGVSCHSLPALEHSVASDWTQVHLVRINPQGSHLDTSAETWNAKSNAEHLPPVVAQLKAMRAKGRGIIGMKLIGEGKFTQPEDREKSIRYVMQSGLCDSVTIGVKSTAEIDEAIDRVNRALAEA